VVLAHAAASTSLQKSADIQSDARHAHDVALKVCCTVFRSQGAPVLRLRPSRRLRPPDAEFKARSIIGEVNRRGGVNEGCQAQGGPLFRVSAQNLLRAPHPILDRVCMNEEAPCHLIVRPQSKQNVSVTCVPVFLS